MVKCNHYKLVFFTLSLSLRPKEEKWKNAMKKKGCLFWGMLFLK